MVYAGGTDLLVKRQKGLVRADHLLCLERVDELKQIQDKEDEVFLGGLATHTRISAHPLVQNEFPVLGQALSKLGSPPIRHMGTLGGNLITASPAGDALPPLYALQAQVEILSADSSRRINLKDLITGPGQVSLQDREILAGVWVVKAPEFNLHHFEKVGQRQALAIAIASLAALIQVNPEGVIEKASLAWGSVGPTVVASAQVNRFLEGRPLDMSTLKQAADLARQEVSPIDDIRASAAYRREVAGNLVLRLAQYSKGLYGE
jgi:xanthine dehydrogenase FAD-binding subunit